MAFTNEDKMFIKILRPALAQPQHGAAAARRAHVGRAAVQLSASSDSDVANTRVRYT